MLKLTRYIETIYSKTDIRVPNAEIFQLTKILNSNIEVFIKYYNFDDLPTFNDESEHTCESGENEEDSSTHIDLDAK